MLPPHPLDDLKDCSYDSDGIQCMFLPANTTNLLQPMDQGAVSYTHLDVYKRQVPVQAKIISQNYI